MITILSTGVGLSLQDLGRTGFQRYGIPPSGPMDPAAAAWANRLLGNAPNASVLEMALGGQVLRFEHEHWVAVAGADLQSSTPVWSAQRIPAGTVWRTQGAQHGVWCYLAVAAGWHYPKWLGSSSQYSRYGHGPPLREGESILTASDHDPWPGILRRYPSDPPPRVMNQKLEVWTGPQWETFSSSWQEAFWESSWVVQSQSDRSGYRLRRSSDSQLLEPPSINSEPVLVGSVQVPGPDELIVTMPDGPTLGGYPKCACLPPSARVQLAQTQAGARVQFSLGKGLDTMSGRKDT